MTLASRGERKAVTKRFRPRASHRCARKQGRTMLPAPAPASVAEAEASFANFFSTTGAVLQELIAIGDRTLVAEAAAPPQRTHLCGVVSP